MMETNTKNFIVTNLLALYCVLMPFEEALASSFGSLLKIVAMALIAYIGASNIKGRTFYLYRYHMFLVLWILYMACSLIWVNSIEWWQYFFRLYIVQVIFVCIIEMVPIESFDINKIKNSIILGGCIASAILILFPTASGFTDEGRRTIMILGTVLDPNIVASIIMLGAQIALEKFYKAKRGVIFLFAIATWQFGGILLTGSRGALLAFIFGFILQLVLKLFSKGEKRRAVLMACLGVIAIGIAFTLLPSNLLETRFSKETILGLNELQSGSHNRYTIWMYATKLVIENPIFGYGCGNFFSAIDSVYKVCASHNLYILLLVEGGIIGTLLFVCYIARLLKDLFIIKDFSTFSLLATILTMALTLDTISYKYFWVALIFARLMIRENEYEGGEIYGC